MAIAYGNGQFVAAGSHTSSDGVSWSHSGSDYGGAHGITFGEGVFVGVGMDGITWSTNGTNWIHGTLIPPVTTRLVQGVAHGNGRFVAVGGPTRVLTSPDGSTWTPREVNIEQYVRSVAYGAGRFVATAENALLISSNGLDWKTKLDGRFANIIYRGAALLPLPMTSSPPPMASIGSIILLVQRNRCRA